jgi:hypothetical protein
MTTQDTQATLYGSGRLWVHYLGYHQLHRDIAEWCEQIISERHWIRHSSFELLLALVLETFTPAS